MINYTWKIHAITKRTINSVDSVVFTVVWEKFGIDSDGYSGSVKAAANFSIDEIDENSFVPYDQLTEEIVVDWLRNFINEDVINQGIEAEIEKARSGWMEVRDEYLPWNVVREE